jgi:hypothetical protein
VGYVTPAAPGPPYTFDDFGQYDTGPGTSPFYTGLAPKLLLKNLQVGGGANLFIQEQFIDGTVYDERLPELAGLRAYPRLDSPNQAYVSAAVQGGCLTSLTFSVTLICEVREDADLGAGIPGPYLRRDATLRRTNADGDAFVSD